MDSMSAIHYKSQTRNMARAMQLWLKGYIVESFDPNSDKGWVKQDMPVWNVHHMYRATDPKHGKPLTANEHQLLLQAFPIDYGFNVYSYVHIGNHTTLAKHMLRRVTRALARKGYVQYSMAFNEKDGLTCGSGYRTTSLGREYLKGLENSGK